MLGDTIGGDALTNGWWLELRPGHGEALAVQIWARRMKNIKIWNNDDLAYALNLAAEFLEMEEWPDYDGGKQETAYREAAKRIRRLADKVPPNRPLETRRNHEDS
jgi:hypothetical protein